MGKSKTRLARGLAAALLALVLLAGGCAGPAQAPAQEPEPGSTAEPEDLETLEAERASVQRAAEEKRNRFLWPQETIQKEILGRDVEFILYHGNGWTIHVPASWEENEYGGRWTAPSQCACFEVSKQNLGVNNPKWYRAQQGSWRYETSYAPPFDYYYDDDGGYTPPDGSADYIYFFAPAGEDQSFEFILTTVVGETSEEEKAIQEAMLLSFCLDDSSHVLYSEPYVPGKTEWEAALASLAVESEPLWFFQARNRTLTELQGKGSPDFLSYASALEEYRPGEFVQTSFGTGPEGAVELESSEMITLSLPGMRLWLYVYSGSPWVKISHGDGTYWGELRHPDDPDQMIYDTVSAWLEAERGWTDSRV